MHSEGSVILMDESGEAIPYRVERPGDPLRQQHSPAQAGHRRRRDGQDQGLHLGGPEHLAWAPTSAGLGWASPASPSAPGLATTARTEPLVTQSPTTSRAVGSNLRPHETGPFAFAHAASRRPG